MQYLLQRQACYTEDNLQKYISFDEVMQIWQSKSFVHFDNLTFDIRHIDNHSIFNKSVEKVLY